MTVTCKIMVRGILDITNLNEEYLIIANEDLEYSKWLVFEYLNSHTEEILIK